MKLFPKKIKFHVNKDNLFGKRKELYRDWKIILGLFGLVVLALILFGGLSWWKILSEDLSLETQTGEGVTRTGISSESVSSLLQNLEEKDAEFELIKISPLEVSNPAR